METWARDELFGVGGDDILSGGGGDDFLHGGSGSDDLRGNAGNDVLDGGTGADYMNGTDGNDIYYVDNANDEIGENDVGGSGNDIVYASVSYVLRRLGTPPSKRWPPRTRQARGRSISPAMTIANPFNPMRQTLHGNNGSNILRGEGGDDTLNGYGGSDFLVGGTGSDIMVGGTGDDTYYVDDSSDLFSEFAGQGNDRLAARISIALGGDADIERLDAEDLTSTRAMDLTAGDIANTVFGNNGVNIFAARAATTRLRALAATTSWSAAPAPI